MRTMLAYAESADGVSWLKPDVGTVEYNGSRDNNLVFGLDLSLGRHAIGAYVFKDPAALPDEAYKLVHMGGTEGGSTCGEPCLPTSCDGGPWSVRCSPTT